MFVRALLVSLAASAATAAPGKPAPHAASPATAEPKRGAVVAVLPFTGLDDNHRIADGLRRALGALSQTTGLVAQPANETAHDVALAQATGLACTDVSPSCLLRMGGFAGADRAVGGDVRAAPGGRMATATFVDVAGGKASAAVTSSLLIPDDDKAAQRALRLLAVRLVAPELERGSVSVHVTQSGATVLVDGLPRGISPLTQALAVKPGTHEVYVVRPGYASRSEKFDVSFEESVNVDVDLVPGDGGPLPPAPLVDVPHEESAPAATPPAVPARRFVRIALTNLDVNGVDPRIARIVTEALLLELRKLDDTSVVGMDEIKAMLDAEATRQLLGCEGSSSCIAEIADALGADVILLGSLASVGDGNVFGLRRLDGRTGQVTAQESERLVPAHGEEFLAAVGPLVEKLFPERKLKPNVARGVPPELALRINPPPLSPWVFWSSLAVTGASATAAATLGGAWLYVQEVDVKAAAAAASDANPADGHAIKASQATAVDLNTAMWAAIGTSAGLAGVDVVVALFTNWSPSE